VSITLRRNSSASGIASMRLYVIGTDERSTIRSVTNAVTGLTADVSSTKHQRSWEGALLEPVALGYGCIPVLDCVCLHGYRFCRLIILRLRIFR
jgi:hypothetical protein